MKSFPSSKSVAGLNRIKFKINPSFWDLYNSILNVGTNLVELKYVPLLLPFANDVGNGVDCRFPRLAIALLNAADELLDVEMLYDIFYL